jgi:transcription-repair coupling factor (superfamily II helicase)
MPTLSRATAALTFNHPTLPAVSPLTPVWPQASGQPLAWTRLPGSSRGLALARAAEAHPGPLLVVTRDTRAAQQLEDEIRFYLTDPAGTPLLPFPDWESLPYDAFSPHPDLISERLLTLYRLPELQQGIVLTTVTTLQHRLAPRGYVSGHTFLLTAGENLDLEGFRARLAEAGYQSVAQVMAPGEYAVRGGLVDVFPMGAAVPYRIDLFGEKIESIRTFDPETQRSGDKHAAIRLLPARELPLNPAAVQRFRQAFRARFEGDPQRSALYREVSKGVAPAGIEYYLPLFFEATATLFDYLPAGTLCVREDGADEAAATFWSETAERYRVLRSDRERPILPLDDLFLAPEALGTGLAVLPQIVLSPLAAAPEPAAACAFQAQTPPLLPVNAKADTPHAALFGWLRDYPGRVLVVAETAGRREVLRSLLRDHDFEPEACAGWAAFLAGRMPLGLCMANLEKGLLLPEPRVAVITEPQLYGERVAQRRRRSKAARDLGTVIRDLAELHLSDPVVHEEHGVGRYRGLQILDVGDGPTEFLTLEYQGGDKLYVPVTDLGRVTRYTGTDPEHAPWHRLGGDAWDKARRRAREKAWDAAVELLEVQALRESRPGHAFPPRDEPYAAFAAAFPFEETPDQERAIDEVLADMERSRPMDRLVCGDVGFGKTEVAMRAAFLAVHGGKQVAVLVPTTLLAQQHYQNFSDRFADVQGRTNAAGDRMSGAADLPIKIELLSRFRTAGEQAKAIAQLAAGRIDIVIGTHRLLQDDVRFQRLGLVIIDEEHRFGVRQKERLKKLRSEVDILTLTATPVPRTLNLALSGLREVSLIGTPPQARLSIKTFVLEWNDALIREACLREIRRGGQVLFLHNDVRTMDRMLERLTKLVPEAEIRIAHGQMPERDLERTMLDFYHQRFNILLCSTIIETGIDIPTANTIIIERADKFGLAQLHQLRGRVGRSHHRAYAYLLIPPHAALTGDALKRLEAIAALEDLGAGFALASHDLEIRGAGELLGEAQSGQIDEVGFAMYSDLLTRAVESLKTGRAPDFDTPLAGGAEINLHAPALLPAEYVPDVHMRLVHYKRVAGAKNREDLDDLLAETVDRFGPMPDAAKLLFQVTALKLRAAALGVKKIEAGPKGARIEFVDKPDIEPGRIIRLLQSSPQLYRLDGPDKLRITSEMPDAAARIAALQTLFDALATPSPPWPSP